MKVTDHRARRLVDLELQPIYDDTPVNYKRGDVITVDFRGSSVIHREHGRQAIVLSPLGTSPDGKVVYEVLVGTEKMMVNTADMFVTQKAVEKEANRRIVDAADPDEAMQAMTESVEEA